MIRVIKKDGTKEDFNVQKVVVAVNKSAYRALIKFTDEELDYICRFVEEKVQTLGIQDVPIAEMHNVVEGALEKVNPVVAKSYRDYRNYKQDFVQMLDEVYKKSQSIMYIGDKENSNTDSALVSTKRSLIFNELNKELYKKFFLTVEEIQAIREGYIYIHDMSARRDTMNCCLFDVKNVLSGGFEMGNLWYNEPKTLDTAFDVIGDIVFNQRDAKVNELKETSGNRDFSQGSTSSGVTAASAIAALQEAGSKLSRDMIKGTYTAYQEIVELTVELIRQFYDLPRCYRITKENGAAEYVQLTNQGLKDQAMPGIGDDLSIRRPVFDIKISAQKASPYSRIAQNELAKELYGLGVFNPQMADQALCVLRMMDFDRRDEVIQMIERNGTMYQQMQQMQGTMMQMAALIAKTTGDTSIMQTLQEQGVPGPDMTAISADAGQPVKTDSLGRAVNVDNSLQGKARQRVNSATEVQS